jgi:flagellar hook assembly protein FlgD
VKISAGSSEEISTETILPEGYTLEQNYPNPFNPETEIRFTLPEAGQVTVKIFNTTGQEIRTLANGTFQAGYQTLRWDGRDQSGNAVAAGVYLYQITATGANGEVKFNDTKRMAFVK